MVVVIIIIMFAPNNFVISIFPAMHIEHHVIFNIMSCSTIQATSNAEPTTNTNISIKSEFDIKTSIVLSPLSVTLTDPQPTIHFLSIITLSYILCSYNFKCRLLKEYIKEHSLDLCLTILYMTISILWLLDHHSCSLS